MKFTVTLDRDEDGVWIAECPSIPGCVSQGDTRGAAIANVREAIRLCLEVRAARGMPLTIATWQVGLKAGHSIIKQREGRGRRQRKTACEDLRPVYAREQGNHR